MALHESRNGRKSPHEYQGKVPRSVWHAFVCVELRPQKPHSRERERETEKKEAGCAATHTGWVVVFLLQCIRTAQVASTCTVCAFIQVWVWKEWKQALSFALQVGQRKQHNTTATKTGRGRATMRWGSRLLLCEAAVLHGCSNTFEGWATATHTHTNTQHLRQATQPGSCMARASVDVQS